MSYVTFEINDGKLTTDKPVSPLKGIASTTATTLKQPVEIIDTNPMDDNYNGDYHAQADAECMMLDDDIYFS